MEKTVSLRMVEADHGRLIKEARRRGVSLNQLLLAMLGCSLEQRRGADRLAWLANVRHATFEGAFLPPKTRQSKRVRKKGTK